MAKQTTKPAADQDTPADAPAAPKGTKVYEVTDKAPPYVAGRRASVGTKLTLTVAEARSELLAGHIWPDGLERKTKPAEAASNDV